MINISMYKEYFTTGLWHVHTNYTDGKHSVDELCKYAIHKKYPLICFAEHIRLVPDYDVNAFIRDIHEARDCYKNDLIVLLAFEAKLLAGGALDIDTSLFDVIDLIYFAEHSYNGDYTQYISDMIICLQKYPISVWAHPFLLPHKKKWKVEQKHIEDLVRICSKQNIAVEFNKRYQMPGEHTKEFFLQDSNLMIVNGEDMHEIKNNEL